MTRILIIIVLTSFSLRAFGQETKKLFPFIEGNLWGYIDNTGKVAIKPQFFSAGQFSEGLAPVRYKGEYGYIDNKGMFKIEAVYDLALPFQNGLAKVFIDSKPYFIDKKGKVAFEHDYKNMSEFHNNSFSIVTTHTEKYGVINKMGKLVIDTAFAKISQFSNGIAIVTGLNHRPYAKDSTEKINFEKGVIDTLGNWLVKYGTYKEIGEFKNGYAHVELLVEKQKGYYNHHGVINERGEYKFTVPSKKWNFDYQNDAFYQNIAIVSIYSVDPDTVRMWSSNQHYDYRGIINPNGEIIFSNSDWYELTPFTFNRAFAKDKLGNWHLINKKGQIIPTQPIKEILFDVHRNRPENLFQNGISFIETEIGLGAIDTTGRFVIEPRNFNDIDFDHLIRGGEIIFLEEDISTENHKYSYRYGFWNTIINTIIKPEYHYIDMNAFDKELISVMKDGQIGYINASGKQIWKQKKNFKYDNDLNIDFMNRGYYYASSKYKKELAGHGGWGSSDNTSKQITSKLNFAPNSLQIVVDPTQKTKWDDRINALKLFVVNTSSDTLYFDAQDSRLYLKIQAKDRKGIWKDIEYLPSSWCGNSYHTLFLAPNELWEFSTPVYNGEFQTRFRAQLFYKKSTDQKKADVIYSNEFDGYVNPGQFWNKREYNPNGLMDPYND